MGTLIFIGFIAFGIVAFFLAVGNENKKELKALSPSQEKAYENIHQWANGNFDPIIRTVHNKS